MSLFKRKSASYRTPDQPCRDHFSRPQNAERCFAAQRRVAIPTIDLVPIFHSAKADGKTGRMTIGKDFHWTETGHLVAARAIANYLAARATSERRGGFAPGPGRPAVTSAD